MGFCQIFLVLVERRKNVLHRVDPAQQRRYVAADVLQAIREIVLAVVGFEVEQRAFELVLTVADLGEDGLDRAALVGDLADHLAQPLLAAADLGELVVHVGGLVAALLEQRALLGLAQLVVERGDGLPRVALDQVLDGGIEVILQGVGDDDVFPGLLEAVAERVEAPVLAREPPCRGADQRQPGRQDRTDRDALRHRQARKRGGQMGDVVTERLRGEKRDCREQDNPGNQEKQPHRDVPTPAHIFAMIAIGERNRDQGPDGLPDVFGRRNPRLVALAGRGRRGVGRARAVIPGRRKAPSPESDYP